MVGTIIFVIILLIIMPVGILMSFGALAGIVGHLAKTGVDSDHVTEEGESSELLTISEADPWAGRADSDTTDQTDDADA